MLFLWKDILFFQLFEQNSLRKQVKYTSAGEGQETITTRKQTAMANILFFVIWIVTCKTCCSLCFTAEKGTIINNSFRSLTTVPERLASHVKLLDLSQNKITEIQITDFASLPLLKSLNLSSNLIKDLMEDVFSINKELECLDLSRNELSNTSGYFLQGLGSLKYLDISSNSFLTLTLGKAFGSLNSLKYLLLGSNKEIKLWKTDLKEISNKQLYNVSIGLERLSKYERGTLQLLKTTKLDISLPTTNDTNLLKSMLTDAFSFPETLKLSNIACEKDCSHYLNAFTEAIITSKVSKLVFQEMKLNWKSLIEIVNIIWCSTMKDISIFYLTILEVNPIKVNTYCESFLQAFSLKHVIIMDHYFDQNDLYDVFASLTVENITISQANLIFMTCPNSGNKYKFMDLSGNVFSRDFFFQDCQDWNFLETLILSECKLDSFLKISSMTVTMTILKYLDVSQNQLTLGENPNCQWTESLVKLNLSLNKLTNSVFSCLPSSIEILDMNNNRISSVPNNLNKLEALKELYLGGNKLVTLPECSSFVNLEILFVDVNLLHEVSSSLVKSCSKLNVLNVAHNPFTCTCGLREFSRIQQELTTLQLIGWPESYQCASPVNLKGTLLKNFHLSEVNCNTALLLVIVLCSVTVLTVVTGVMCHFLDLPWYLRMVWQWTQTKQRAMKKDGRQPTEGLVFHAFVSYSQHDSCWVKEELIPNLEEGGCPLRICLHERHFIPGRSIIENIIRCIEKSYKSIFVVSPHFIQSEWCHYELYFAQHQVLSEKSDKLILILLEPIPQYLIPSKYHKLKSLMGRKTYIEWPKDRNKHGLFWANLRATLKINLELSSEETTMV
uniref:Toll like receptor 6 n=1 Tax=Callorhinchus milii TaxID=7868 RepID=A0A4W3IDU0_CALMI